MEHVNHPVHYNKHPGGIECIEIIRHYTFDTGCAIKYLWRAGLKTEMGRSNRDKEREDLQRHYGMQKITITTTRTAMKHW